MKITYGTININVDITQICYNKLLKNNIITIPSNDHVRAYLFTDPIVGSLKKIFVVKNDNSYVEYDDNFIININIVNDIVYIMIDIDYKIKKLHDKLKINYGNFSEELPEQKMVIKYLTGNEKVLEIGGNIGRNSLIISSVLTDDKNFVSLECDTDIANQLKENRDLNNMNFYVENSALSKRKLIQKGWDTIVSDVLLPDYKPVNIISLEELKTKYNINFDTLVLDCEGAFYYILMDIPELLNNINLIIMENDYWDISHKNFINEILIKNNFYIDHSESGGWGPCTNYFFEVWKKQ